MASTDQTSPIRSRWVFANAANVHACKDAGCFQDYMPFPSFAISSVRSAQPSMLVLGIGVVELPVKKSPHSSGSGGHTTLRLTNVLHIPSLDCNIIGGPVLKQYIVTLSCGATSQGGDAESRGRHLAFFDPLHDTHVCTLGSSPEGHSVESHAVFGADLDTILPLWPNPERVRWEQNMPKHGQQDEVTKKDEHDTRESEHDSVSESKSYHSDWSLTFTLGQVCDAIDQYCHEPDSRTLDELLPTADDQFDSEELDYIERNWDSAEDFMAMYGLRVYNDEDCEMARELVRGFMDDDASEEEDSGIQAAQVNDEKLPNSEDDDEMEEDDDSEDDDDSKHDDD
ncbi:hypothetical protein F4778DRAFT_761142 [Xylariomycetidae sp. FL2044]|nr:hypothetical protein F4778DRAFT_761142 [Xylariomycetidae sp. FL2044]